MPWTGPAVGFRATEVCGHDVRGEEVVVGIGGRAEGGVVQEWWRGHAAVAVAVTERRRVPEVRRMLLGGEYVAQIDSGPIPIVVRRTPRAIVNLFLAHISPLWRPEISV